jgi:hypothetical protein
MLNVEFLMVNIEGIETTHIGSAYLIIPRPSHAVA